MVVRSLWAAAPGGTGRSGHSRGKSSRALQHRKRVHRAPRTLFAAMTPRGAVGRAQPTPLERMAWVHHGADSVSADEDMSGRNGSQNPWNRQVPEDRLMHCSCGTALPHGAPAGVAPWAGRHRGALAGAGRNHAVTRGLVVGGATTGAATRSQQWHWTAGIPSDPDRSRRSMPAVVGGDIRPAPIPNEPKLVRG